jgi:hypothetical protein
LYRTFITTATAQQAVQQYAHIRFSCKEGVMAFYRELLMWARQLAQYPDPSSFKRRLFGGLPAEYRNHLTLYEEISAKDSSIDEIVLKARHLEKTLISLKSGQGQDRQPAQGTPMASEPQVQTALRDRQRFRNQRNRPPQYKSEVEAGKPELCPAQKAVTGDHGKPMAAKQST